MRTVGKRYVKVGAAQVRGAVLGFDNVQPDPKQLEKMKKLVAQAMDQGAFGLSTGLIYQPGSFAKTDEIVALAQVASARGGIYARLHGLQFADEDLVAAAQGVPPNLTVSTDPS